MFKRKFFLLEISWVVIGRVGDKIKSLGLDWLYIEKIRQLRELQSGIYWGSVRQVGFCIFGCIYYKNVRVGGEKFIWWEVK